MYFFLVLLFFIIIILNQQLLIITFDNSFSLAMKCVYFETEVYKTSKTGRVYNNHNSRFLLLPVSFSPMPYVTLKSRLRENLSSL